MAKLHKENCSFGITNRTRHFIPRSLLERVFSIAAKHHTIDISLVFVGERAMKGLNKKWRGKDASTNVLAFPLDSRLGEIFINPFQAEREAKIAGTSFTNRIVYLFVHGLLHLQGFDHETERDAERMEKEEQKILNYESRSMKYGKT